MPKRFILAVAMIVVIVGVISFISERSRQQSAEDKIQVSASFYPLAEFVRQVGGNKVSVNEITPIGTEPHDYEPSPQDIIKIRRSSVFIYSGAGFEPWAEKAVSELPKSIKVINASEGVPLLPAAEGEGEKTASRKADPHFYLDPLFDKKIIDNIARELSQIDPSNKGYFKQNASLYKAELDGLNKSYRRGLRKRKRNDIVTSHAAFAYLAKRYHLVQIPIAGFSEEEPSPQRIAEIARFTKRNNVEYIFFEKLASPRLSKTIAREAGAKTLVLNPIEGLTAEEKKHGEDFISLMKKNLSNLQLALEVKRETN